MTWVSSQKVLIHLTGHELGEHGMRSMSESSSTAHAAGSALSRRGIPLALGAAALFGLSMPLAKGLIGSARPQLVAGLLYLGSGVGLGSFWLLTRSRRQASESPLTRTDLPWLAGAIAAGGIVAPVLLMLGLARTQASGASLLLNLEGVFTALLAWFAFRENFDRRIALGMLAILIGAAFLSWQGDLRLGGVVGPLLVAAACLMWGIDNNLTQKVSAGDPVQTTALKGIVAGTVNTTIAVLLGATWPGAWSVASAMGLGLVSYGLSLVLYVRALRLLGTARTGAYFALAPFVGAVLALVIWRDPITPGLLGAAGFMALGVWLHVTERHEHEHVHETMAHEHAHVHDEHHQHAHGPNDPSVTDPSPHSHWHEHEALVHTHAHYPDIHHRHDHEHKAP
jgi:drug/metabolite transporter (DMT)-like permease